MAHAMHAGIAGNNGDLIEKKKKKEEEKTSTATTTPTVDNSYLSLLQEALAEQKSSGFKYSPSEQYKRDYNALKSKLLTRSPYNYNPATDSTAQQIRREYVQGGKVAARDALGTASAMTGGMNNSYAQQAAQQAYGSQMASYATNVIPTLEQLARQRYESETNDILTKMKILQTDEQTRYDRAYDAWDTEQDARADLLKSYTTATGETNSGGKIESDEADAEADKIMGKAQGILDDNDGTEDALSRVFDLVSSYTEDPAEIDSMMRQILAGQRVTYQDYLDWINEDEDEKGGFMTVPFLSPWKT